MSNLTGNYKISLGEVQGVDVVKEREQERRARMQLLDDIREPSPTPIFGVPVKVDLEDETTRRIKNTLGDFTQVLENDPKNLIGISPVKPERPTSSGHENGHQSNGYTSTGHPVNGYSMSGHPNPGHMTYSTSSYSSNGHSSTGHPPGGNPSMGHCSAPFARPQAAFKKQHYPANGTSSTKQSMPNYVAPKAPDKRINYNRSDKPGYSYKSDPLAAPKSYHSSTGTPQAPFQTREPSAWEQRRALQPSHSQPPQPPPQQPPPPFNINVNAESTVTINNITMCNNSISTSAPIWNCGPDTPAIQINPFHLPSNATPSNPAKTTGYGQSTTTYSTNPVKTESEKVTNTPPKRNQFRPSSLKLQTGKKEAPIAVETILKVMTKAVPSAPLTAIQTPRTEETGFAFPAEPKEDTPFFKGIEQISLIQPFDDDLKPEPEPKDVIQHSSKPYVSSLQDDLEMSDSDEEAVPEVKSNPDQFLRSPVSDIATSSTTTVTTTVPNPTVSTNSDTKMDANSAESSNSSSSESGDSDSDDSSSESNDSDSSSEASDEEISSKKWGLSNFVDESQRMHSPRFFQADAAAKGALRLHSERMKSLALGNINSMTGTVAAIKDPSPLPVTEQTTTFLVPDVPVTTKSEILSPIPSPIHAAVGPRTPPSPSCALNQDCPETNEDNIQTPKSPEKIDVPETIDHPIIPNSPHSDKHLSSDISEQKGYVQNEKCKKQLRSNTAKVEELNEPESSPSNAFVNENNIFKESFEISSEKESATTESEKFTPNSLPSENIEIPPDNYSIKTRQRGSAASSAKKNKSSENSQKAESESSPAIAKLKHPRACRKPNEKQLKKAGTNITSTKPDIVEQPKKRKSDSKENKSGPERVVDPVKSSGSVKTVKSARKNKTVKVPQKEIPEIKKSEPKKKKFAIENFVQSPEISRPATASQIFSPSPERSPLPECEKGSPETSTSPSVSTTVPNKAPCKSNLKSTEACKNVEKLRRSVRCSERASNNAQTEASSTPRASSESKKSSKNLSKTKCRVENLLSIEGVDRLELLSPIPMDPSVSTETSNSAIPMKIMVSIPFAKLLRLPAGVQQPPEAENMQGYRSRSASIDEGKSQKDSASSDQSTNKAVTAKRSLSKEVKDKTKTINPLKSSKSNIKSVSAIKKDKVVKSTSEASNKSKIASSVNKSSIKIKSKTYCDDTENTLPKKRKNEGKDQPIAKKKKVSEEKKLKESPSVAKSDSTPNIEEGTKTKLLERCDSTGSLSSLCSQQSQRSSKSCKEKKKDSSGGPESKRMKSSTPLIKDIKQEKEDRPKVHIKKEPRTADKNKVKSRDKASAKDISCAEKYGDQIWEDSLTSSQFFRWDEQCNDDPKGKLVTNQSLEDADRALADWDHFAPDKVMKEGSTLNKHNNPAPIMPMDYYYTEGRKQKQIAEKEKDPFQQAVKYFEAAVLFILTSQQKEEYTKDPQAIYQFYEKTLKYFGDIQAKVKGLQSCPGSTEFKLLILCLKCQSLLYVKLYNIKIKEIKEQTDYLTIFLRNYAANAHNLPPHSRQVSSPHSTISSPASSVNTQSNLYGSGLTGTEMCLRSNIPGCIAVPQKALDMICHQHTHLVNLHRGHDNWEQADMYMTRSNLREFFKEVADQSEPLTLHSSITELVKYIQKGISLVKKSLR